MNISSLPQASLQEKKPLLCKAISFAFSLQAVNGFQQTKKDDICRLFFAERARFELADRFPHRQFSKLLVSATHPPLRVSFLKSAAKIHFFCFEKIYCEIFFLQNGMTGHFNINIC